MPSDEKKIQRLLQATTPGELAIFEAMNELETKVDETADRLNIDKILSSVKGEKGDRGEQGEVGPQGSRGPEGIEGAQGERGPKGDSGKDGKPGRDGKDGADGIDGVDGAPGKDGAMGPMPRHRWEGTSLAFEQPDGSWSASVNLQGPAGNNYSFFGQNSGGGSNNISVRVNGRLMSSGLQSVDFIGSAITATNADGRVSITIAGFDPDTDQHLNNNHFLTMGNTAEDPYFRIGYKIFPDMGGGSLEVAQLTIPDNKPLVIGFQANANIDPIGGYPGPLPQPTLFFEGAEITDQNKFALIGFAFDNDRRFDFQFSSGDTITESPKNADGVTFRFAAGDGGSSGGNAGGGIFATGSGNFGNVNGGDIDWQFGQGSGTGRSGRFTGTTIGNYTWKMPGAFLEFQLVSSADDAKILSFAVDSGQTTIQNTGDAFSVVQTMTAGITNNFKFSPTGTLSAVPDSYFKIVLPQYNGLPATKDVIDFEIASGGMNNVNFVGGGASTSSNLYVASIDGRTYSADSAQTLGSAVTLRLGAPINAGNLTFTNGLFSLVTGGAVSIESFLQISGRLGVGTSPDTAAWVTVASSGGEPALLAPDGSGAIIATGSVGSITQMRWGLVGSWVDSVDTTVFQMGNATNNNLLILGGKYGTEAALGRTMFNTTTLQIFGGDRDTLVAPVASSFVEIVSSSTTKVNLKLVRNASQTVDLLQFCDSTGASLSTVSHLGTLGIGARAPVGSETTKIIVGGDYSTSQTPNGGGNQVDGGSALWFNSLFDVGNPSAKTVAAGYSGRIRVDGTAGAMQFALAGTAAADANVTMTTALSIDQSLYATFFGGISVAENATFLGRILANQITTGSANSLTLGDANSFVITGAVDINEIATAGWTNGSVIVLTFNPGGMTVANDYATPTAGFAPIRFKSGVDLVPAQDQTVNLIYIGNNWFEI